MKAVGKALELDLARPLPTRTGMLLLQRQLMGCLVAAASVWGILFYFGRRTSYAGDDVIVLRPLFNGGLLQSLHRSVRPLEYWTGVLSHQAEFPVWLVVSLLAYIGTAMGTWVLLSLMTRNREPRFWQILVCACSPLAAQAYFQIDTVSQALANFFSLVFIIVSLHCIKSTRLADIRSLSWAMTLVALMCILSKETTYGIVLFGSLLTLFHHRKQVVVPVLCIQLLLALAVLWSLFNTYDITDTTSQYGLKVNPLYWIFGLVFSIAVAAAPISTSILLTGAFLKDAVLAGIAATGLLVVLTGLILFWPSLSAALRPRSISAAFRKENFGIHHILGLYLVFAVVPSVFLKAGELYASQMTPILAVLLIAATPEQSRIKPSIFWPICCFGWVLTSTINIMYYSVATGYEPLKDAALAAPERGFYASIQNGVAKAPFVYSIYFPGIYEFYYVRNQAGRLCEISVRQPDVCLPKDIASGFPERL